MAVSRPSVEGPEFLRLIRETEDTVRRLEEAAWDFEAAPEVFAKQAAADVVAKELIHIHDGRSMTRLGRLVMGGRGTHFNLMGPFPSDSEFAVLDPSVLDHLTAELGTQRLEDTAEWRQFRDVQPVQFYNYTLFYTLREMVTWLVLHEAGCFPSTMEHMVRQFAQGNIVQSSMYSPSRIPQDGSPALMQTACLRMEFPSKTVEWMDKPLFGGFAPTTHHVEHLLTLSPTDVSHPYLPPVAEGKVRLAHQSYYFRTYVGETPKDGVRNGDVPAERPDDASA